MKRKELYTQFVKQAHKDQLRKYTNQPYFEAHLKHVADTVNYLHPLAYEIGLGHDLFEDTEVSKDLFEDYLLFIEYSQEETDFIIQGITDLTDVYTSVAYPSLNRAQRKIQEAHRLANISKLSQSIKYADLIDNTSSILKYDPDFAKVYLKEKQFILSLMNKGDAGLYREASQKLEKAMAKSPIMDEVYDARGIFNLEDLIEVQLEHSVQIIRGGDMQYMCYIDNKVYATGMTMFFALVYGICKFKEKVKK